MTNNCNRQAPIQARLESHWALLIRQGSRRGAAYGREWPAALLGRRHRASLAGHDGAASGPGEVVEFPSAPRPAGAWLSLGDTQCPLPDTVGPGVPLVIVAFGLPLVVVPVEVARTRIREPGTRKRFLLHPGAAVVPDALRADGLQARELLFAGRLRAVPAA